MPNVTISVSGSLKVEMDKIPEVSWSEICRGAISRYIAQRKNPTPRIELELRNSRITPYDSETGYPTLSLDLHIHNKMDSEIMVDRVLANARFLTTDDNRVYGMGVAYDLRKKLIAPNSSGFATLHLIIPNQKIVELKDAFKATFDCQALCTVFVEDFRNEYNKNVKTSIPIDHWKNFVAKALKKSQAD